jgi:hypothetical protein
MPIQASTARPTKPITTQIAEMTTIAGSVPPVSASPRATTAIVPGSTPMAVAIRWHEPDRVDLSRGSHSPELFEAAALFPQDFGFTEWLHRWTEGTLHQPAVIEDEHTGQLRGATDADYRSWYATGEVELPNESPA